MPKPNSYPPPLHNPPTTPNNNSTTVNRNATPTHADTRPGQGYGIDGVAIQRFGVEVGAERHKRVLNYSLAAAAATGRVLFIEYDLSGMHEADIV